MRAIDELSEPSAYLPAYETRAKRPKRTQQEMKAKRDLKTSSVWTLPTPDSTEQQRETLLTQDVQVQLLPNSLVDH